MPEKTNPTVLVIPYDPNWVDQFESLKASLENCLGVLIHSVHHVGSIAVPGLELMGAYVLIVHADQINKTFRTLVYKKLPYKLRTQNK